LPEPVDVKVEPALVNDTRLSSTLVTDTGVRVGTIEHLMSAFAGFGIDNLVVEVTAAEIPIMDGSAAPSFTCCKVQAWSNKVAKRFIRVKQPLEIIEGDKWVRLDPMDGFKITLSIEFNHPAFNLAPQKVEIDFANSSYLDEISRARTFGFMHEVEYMRQHGLGLGGSLDNAIVIDDEYVLNPEGLRSPTNSYDTRFWTPSVTSTSSATR
jgi:UDP-3-O-[3-hydroxymyristoyl] N-acetylglucosamine deacetylase